MNVKQWLEEHRDALCADLSGLISIPSVRGPEAPRAPFGAEVGQCLDRALAVGERLGLRCGRMDGWCGWCEWGEGERLVSVLAHLDVVPEGDGWSVPPYDGAVREGRIYGRGAIDDKGPAVAALYALAALKACGAKLPCRVRVLLGTNEESGCAGIRWYLEHGGERPAWGFTPDGAYPVINGEKTVIDADFTCRYEQRGDLRLTRLSGGTAPNSVPSTAQAEFSCPKELAEELCGQTEPGLRFERLAHGFRVTAEGVSAHGATPWEGKNAIGSLLAFLDRLPLDNVLHRHLSFLSQKIGCSWDGTGLGLACSDAPSGDLTFNLGVIQGDSASLRLRVNIRVPVSLDGGGTAEKLKKVFIDAGFFLESLEQRDGFYYPPDHPLIRTLLDVYAEQTGEPGQPVCIGGGTYAKAVPNVVAFGPVFPGDEVREHQADEFIEIGRLMENARMIAAAMEKLAELTMEHIC